MSSVSALEEHSIVLIVAPNASTHQQLNGGMASGLHVPQGHVDNNFQRCLVVKQSSQEEEERRQHAASVRFQS